MKQQEIEKNVFYIAEGMHEPRTGEDLLDSYEARSEEEETFEQWAGDLIEVQEWPVRFTKEAYQRIWEDYARFSKYEEEDLYQEIVMIEILDKMLEDTTYDSFRYEISSFESKTKNPVELFADKDDFEYEWIEA